MIADASRSARRPAAPPAAGVGRRWGLFVLLGLALYLGLYLAAEALVYRYGLRNRFYMVATAPLTHYDAVILGASHAMPFDFEDMNARLEQASGASVLNLSIEGGGILPARLMLEYFLAGHGTDRVVYVLDSFAFYSRQWNEDRLADAGLLRRAPFDPALVAALARHRWSRPLLLDYVSGFSKINNPDRFEPDVTRTETAEFARVYRPIPYLDQQRIAYLYPAMVDPAVFHGYLAELENFVGFVEGQGIDLVVMKPPLPPRVLAMLPGEAAFDQAVAALVSANGGEFHDFANVNNDEGLFYNTDHLNRDGVLAFIDGHLAPLLTQAR